MVVTPARLLVWGLRTAIDRPRAAGASWVRLGLLFILLLLLLLFALERVRRVPCLLDADLGRAWIGLEDFWVFITQATRASPTLDPLRYD